MNKYETKKHKTNRYLPYVFNRQIILSIYAVITFSHYHAMLFTFISHGLWGFLSKLNIYLANSRKIFLGSKYSV